MTTELYKILPSPNEAGYLNLSFFLYVSVGVFSCKITQKLWRNLLLNLRVEEFLKMCPYFVKVWTISQAIGLVVVCLSVRLSVCHLCTLANG